MIVALLAVIVVLVAVCCWAQARAIRPARRAVDLAALIGPYLHESTRDGGRR